MTFEQREELHEVFDTIDQAGRGYIPISRVSDVLQALGLVSPSAKDWEQWCARVDFDKTGRIGYETLEEFVSLRYDEMDQRTEMVAAFMLFKPGVTDVEKAKITIDDLRRIAAHTGEHIPDEELEEMVRIADIDGTEGVSFDDFMRIMRKTGLF
ncbi:centrin-like protein [Coemansia reversa NRRL 1564]|uniref:Centrin-like protein n=1 Tax=Coemansia reversa (strain ATCC 12441 / NRRL 1564) TaxID=763665 RepID=A0A2G5BKP0_COERN|nr:centrin-like protein [Coemansia reversa NRRL 1564]|eukprot:PIA19584.1 centrin-like protein [Coemansia reversa NRRL 1564]